ncbi:MAG: hypothetical protein A2W22_00050 [Candidatus Levybacteria bacterium RBG_16_35_11]|nr:MAG: hypothetical protein A2W22_00050 [Candidatus Levybacteria bacterium RBG_16_35_11]
MRVRDRATEIKGIFYTHCREIIDGSPAFKINESKNQKNCGAVSEKMKLIDGSLINFFEIIVDGNIHEYSYEYVRHDTGFFFHYQNEGIDEGIKKPLNHLHVGIKKVADKKLLDILPDELIEHGGPHYMAPEMKFNDFMGMIIVNYFDNHKNRNRMMKALGLL